LTATPRKLQESEKATTEDKDITANNYEYFGEAAYEYTLIQAQEDGYLAATGNVGGPLGVGTVWKLIP
jgi:type I restriction enzyme, R subunit